LERRLVFISELHKSIPLYPEVKLTCEFTITVGKI